MVKHRRQKMAAETYGKDSEFQSLSGTEAERYAVGRGDTEAERQASYCGTLWGILGL